MLTFEEKLAIIESFPELKRKDVSLGRVNFHYEDSATEKKNVVYHLHPNGNGYVYAEQVKGYDPDDRGLVNIHDFSESELRKIISKSIHSLSLSIPPKPSLKSDIEVDAEQETWINSSNQTLLVIHEDQMWNVYAGLNLDGTFTSYIEAQRYLEEERFKRKNNK